MILTTCAACAKPLEHDAPAHCVNCQTRYCTRGDLREATTTLEDSERTARRVLGGAHPLVLAIEQNLRDAQEALYARGLP